MLSTIGYEGAAPQDFLQTLVDAKVTVVADIRHRAQSRRPGFSKSALADALELAGIAYVHHRALGDPKEGRDAARAGDLPLFRRIFAEVMRTDEAKSAVEEIADLAKLEHVCLLCYERDFVACHRKIVADKLEAALGIRARHLGVRANDGVKQQGRRVLHTCKSAAA